MKKYKMFLSAILLFLFSIITAYSQVRIAIFPFQNMDGDLKYNIWSYNLQDSLTKSMGNLEQNGTIYYIVPADSVEIMLADLNLDPNNPQYQTDMWKVAKKLNVKKVVTGNFNIQANRFLLNAYVYDVKLKLPHPQYQARDIFKKEEDLYEAVGIIVEELLPAF